MPGFQSLITDLRSAEKQLEKQLSGVRDAIASLESGGDGQVRGRGRRAGAARGGRRSMSAAARKAVSIRMRKYWAERRKAKAK